MLAQAILAQAQGFTVNRALIHVGLGARLQTRASALSCQSLSH